MTRERAARSSLLALVAAPLVWVAHFALSYATAAIWCAKLAGPDRSLGTARLAIATYTVVALVAIFVIGWRALRSVDSVPEDRDTPEARHHFVAFATVLLAGLSAIAIIYAALATVLVGSCH